MKIKPTQIEKLYAAMAVENATMAPNSREAENRKVVEQDSLSLSGSAKNHSHIDNAVDVAASQAIKSTPAEKLLRLKGEIQNGTYAVPSDAIASAMLGQAAGEEYST